MLDKIKQIISEIGSFTATTPAEVEQFRIKHLSKKGTIAALFDDFKRKSFVIPIRVKPVWISLYRET